jgi:hypothetical protein
MDLRQLYYELPERLGDQRNTLYLAEPNIANELPPSCTWRGLFVSKVVLIEQRWRFVSLGTARDRHLCISTGCDTLFDTGPDPF